jgi:hypothetical protein
LSPTFIYAVVFWWAVVAGLPPILAAFFSLSFKANMFVYSMNKRMKWLLSPK